MNRRHFIKNTALGTTLLSTQPIEFMKDDLIHLTILHTNDVHSHIEPFPSDHPRNPNMGGVTNRAQIIEKIRNENPNVLLLDAGDSFQGTPYFNFFGGAIEWQLMSKLNYQATTIGNHEFDNGLQGILQNVPYAEFDILSANYDFKNTILDGLTKPYNIYHVAGLKIGVFGLGIQLEGLVNKKMYQETKYLDPTEIATDMAKELKKIKKCDFVICLSHLGLTYKNAPTKICDVLLAETTKDIDLIIGGHTHSFLENVITKKNKEGKNVIINQVGAFGIYLGRLDFYFSKGKVKETMNSNIAVK